MRIISTATHILNSFKLIFFFSLVFIWNNVYAQNNLPDFTSVVEKNIPAVVIVNATKKIQSNFKKT